MLTRRRFLTLSSGVGLAALADAGPSLAAPAAPSSRRQNLEEGLRLIATARQSYAAVADYACTLVKRERLNGVMQPDHVITMKVRTRPFSVYLRWHEPKPLTGQEACYVQGKNDGKMRVKAAGLLGSVGFLSLDPDDLRARQTSRRNITEAGLGNLIERVARGWEVDSKRGRAVLRLGEYEYNKRRCFRAETINLTRAPELVCHRSVIFFDKENHLPIRAECYDWPAQKGEPGELIDVYSFVNLRLNVGLDDEVFTH
jgi:hypothetical protein